MNKTTVKSTKSGERKHRSMDGLVIARVEDFNALKAEWQALENEETASIYQSFNWVKIALESLERYHEPVILTGRLDGNLELVLPMVLHGKTIKTLQWVGGNHANIRSGIYSEKFLASSGLRDMEQIIKYLQQSLTGIVSTRLGNQPYTLKGYPNPFSHLPHQQAVNALFLMDLSDGFQALLAAGNAKRKRKKFRAQIRICDRLGGHELLEALTPDETIEALQIFRSLKEQRFRKLGLRDAFQEPNADEFLDRLAAKTPANGIDLLKIFQLKIDGKTRALFGGGVSNNRFHGYFNTISTDEYSHISPGEMLLYLMIEKITADGTTKFDLGAGDEPYKRSWCQNEIELFDTVLPLGKRAVPVAGALRLAVHCKGYIRRNPFLWQKVKSLRRFKGSLSR